MSWVATNQNDNIYQGNNKLTGYLVRLAFDRKWHKVNGDH